MVTNRAEESANDPGDHNGGTTRRLKIDIKPHVPVSQEALDRRARKTAQSSSGAFRQRERVSQIELKVRVKKDPIRAAPFET